MKVLFITDNFPPEYNAPATRTFEHCRAWVENGVDVTVVTCAPNFPQGRVYPDYKNRLIQHECLEGINVIRVWSYMARNVGFVRRVADYLSFSFMAFWASLFRSYDVIVATSPQFFTTFTAFALSKIRRKPWVFELRDLWPESIDAVGAVKSRRLISLLEKIELHLYRDAALVVAVTDAFKENLVRRGIPPQKISVITNGVDSKRFRPSSKDQTLVQELGLNGKFVIGYLGTHGLAHGLDFIVRSLAGFGDQSVHFLFVGDGAEKQKVLELAGSLGVTNATFIDSVPKSEMARYLSAFDAALVPLRRSETFKTVIPSKIFESAAMEKPILLGVDGQARKIVEQYEAGIFYEPENSEDFQLKVSRLLQEAGLYKALQAGCRTLADAYDRERLANIMLDDLKAVVKQHSSRRTAKPLL